MEGKADAEIDRHPGQIEQRDRAVAAEEGAHGVEVAHGGNAIVVQPHDGGQPHDGLAVRRKAEVTRLDDSCVHRTHRDLVQALSFRGEERILGRRGW